MFTRTINISSLEDAKAFVNVTSKYDDIRMRLRIDDYEVNAHSIVGVLSVTDSEKNPVFIADMPDDDKTPYEAMRDYMYEHNYSQMDYPEYSQDPERQALNEQYTAS